jgi:hypothetical protein
MHPFRAAVEAGDIDAAAALLGDDPRFNSPVTYKPFEGREAVEAVLRAAFRVLEGLRYTDELVGEDGTVALFFRARVGDRDVQGVDVLRFGPDGKIDDFTVMVRPMSGVHALAEAMGKQLGFIAE